MASTQEQVHMARERDETGRYVESATLEDVLALFDEIEGPAITSSDVAERFDITTEAARQKLTRLVDRGDLGSRKSGRTTLYWQLADSAEDDV